MADAYEIVTEITAFILQKAEAKGNLSQLATSYAELCRDCNDRLKRCGDFLRRQLRAEAIYHAEIEPDLLDRVTILDMVPGDTWRTICAERELEQAPPLLLDIARDLNAAYSSQEAVQHDLKILRRLSLAQAPLRDRLAALRKLSIADPKNEHWREDVKDYETARVKEIVNEANDGFASGNEEQLQMLIRELSSSTWQVPVADLLASLNAGRKRLYTKRVVQKLQTIFAGLHEAYVAQSLEECRPLLQKWDDIIERTRIEVPEYSSQVQTIREWIRSLDEDGQRRTDFAAACESLREAVAGTMKSRELQALYTQATGFGEALPEDMEESYHAALAKAQRRERRAKALLVVGGVAVILAIATAIGFWSHYSSEAGLTQRLTKEVSQLYSQMKYKEALQEMASQDASRVYLAQDPERQKLKKQIEASQKDLDDLLAKFETQMKEAGTPEKPDTTALTQAKMFAAMIGGNHKVTAPAERAAAFESRAREFVSGNQQKADDLFQAQYAAAREKCVGLEGRIESALSQLRVKMAQDLDSAEFGLLEKSLGDVERGELREMTSLCDSLGSYTSPSGVPSPSPGVISERSKALKERLSAPRQNIEVVRDALVKKRTEAQDFEALAEQTGSVDRLTKALAAYADKYPLASRSKDFRAAAQRAAVWASIEDWNKCVASWQGLLPKTNTEIPIRIAALKAFMEKYPSPPFAESLSLYETYLKKAQDAAKDDSPWRTEFLDTLKLPLMSELHCFVTRTGMTYYTDSKAKFTEDSIGTHITCYLDSTLKKTQKLLIARGDMPSEAVVTPAPQTKLAGELLRQVGLLGPGTWETFGLDLAESITNAAEVDCVLRAILLDMVLDYTKKSGWGTADDVQAMSQKLAVYGVNNLNWIDPKDAKANTARVGIKSTLEQMKFSALKQKVVAKRQSMCQDLDLTRLVARGIIIKVKGKWQIFAPAGSLKDGRAIWAIEADSSGANKLVKIGDVKNGSPQFSAVQMGGAPEGTVIGIGTAASE